MRHLSIFNLLLCFMIVKRDEAAKPNIVYIMGDDIGWNDVGFHNPKVITPNINKLAAAGIELSSNYANPLCSASRSALLTGKYPSKNGFQHEVLLSQAPACLPLQHKTLGEYMKEAGYVTKMVGKWHMGYCIEECLPKQRGFDEYSGMLGGESDYFTWEEDGVMLRYRNNTPHLPDSDRPLHETILDRRDAVEMVLSHQGNPDPLFMMITPTAAHLPLEVTESMYNVHDFLNASDGDDDKRRKYLGLVSALDDLVGATLLALSDTNMLSNTVIVFQSDNGGASMTPEGFPSRSYGNNYPLRASKGSVMEGGVRVPTIYLDPRLEKNTRGTKRDFLMHITDWLPTFLSLAGSEVTAKEIDGVSQLPNLGNSFHSLDRYKVRESFLVNLDTIDENEKVYNCTNRDAAYRWRNWKLVYGVRSTWTMKEGGPYEYRKPEESPELPTITGDSIEVGFGSSRGVRGLFNIRDDPSETRNLYDDYPELVAKMVEMVEKERKHMVASVFKDSQGITDTNTNEMDGVYIPKLGFCNPQSDFLLQHNNLKCKQVALGETCDSADDGSL
ncbi:arylsulfatase B-like [Watersipora subatra]|uniref:arylsulfatase B-like n=1 Tax=Watersipora subatra TaxID=2589382 RepID=UPI00355B3724